MFVHNAGLRLVDTSPVQRSFGNLRPRCTKLWPSVSGEKGLIFARQHVNLLDMFILKVYPAGIVNSHPWMTMDNHLRTPLLLLFA